MKAKRLIQLLLIVAVMCAAVLVTSAPTQAQCAMCRNALTGSPTAARLSQSINTGVIVLLIPPVMIFCGIFIAAFRFRKAQGESHAVERQPRGGLRAWLGRLRGNGKTISERARESRRPDVLN